MDASSCFGTLNFAVGQMYVAHYFPAQTKTKVESFATEVKAAYSRRIEHLSWMSPATKREALRKLDSYTVKVGFPEHPRNYASVEIRRDDLVGDVRRGGLEAPGRSQRGPGGLVGMAAHPPASERRVQRIS